MNDICPTSGTPLKEIPAGVSKKTGKAYDAFYACEVKGCKGPHIPGATYNKAKFPAKDNGGNGNYGRRLALHGFVNALLVNHSIAQVKLGLDELIALEDTIDQKLETKDSVDDFEKTPF